jgi:hypothetical protein
MSGISKSKIGRLCAEIDEKALNTILLNPAGFAEWQVMERRRRAIQPIYAAPGQLLPFGDGLKQGS